MHRLAAELRGDGPPSATQEKPIAQLMVYALALARSTGLRLYDLVCAWFDARTFAG
jgi:hypothetical protein